MQAPVITAADLYAALVLKAIHVWSRSIAQLMTMSEWRWCNQAAVTGLGHVFRFR